MKRQCEMGVSISRRAWDRQFPSPRKAGRQFVRRLPHLRLPALAPVVSIMGSMVVGAALAIAIPRLTGVESRFEWTAEIVAGHLQADESNIIRPTPKLWKALSVPNSLQSHIASSSRLMETEQ